jgi:hypothetical protein
VGPRLGQVGREGGDDQVPARRDEGPHGGRQAAAGAGMGGGVEGKSADGEGSDGGRGVSKGGSVGFGGGLSL